jgi:peptide/nickel transport system substrate-binding protein
LRYAQTTAPAGAIGWPSEFIGTTDGFMQYTLEPLYKVIDREYVPWLATSWDLAKDSSSITFHLRKGVKFHDGSNFDAKAVKFNYDALIAKKVSVARNWKSVDVVDDYTVRVNLSAYTNLMYTDFAQGNAFIVSPTAYEKHGLEWMRENPVGTGPFILESYTHDVNAMFKRNPNYWQEGKPYLDGIEAVWFAEQLTAAAALEAGDIDAIQIQIGSLPASMIAKNFTVESMTDGVISLMFDGANEDSPFHDKRVGQAVDYAIDKEAIVKAKGYGFWKANYQWPLEGFSTYDPNPPAARRYDVDKAKQLLAEAGYPNGFKYRFVVSPQGTDPDVAVAIQSFLGKVGIDVTIETPAYSKYVEYRNVNPWSGAFLMAPLGMAAGMNGFFQSYVLTTNGLFKSMYRPPDVDQMILDSIATPVEDPVKVKAIADYLYDQAMFLPVYATGQAAVYNGNRVHDASFLRGLKPSMWSPWDAWLSK